MALQPALHEAIISRVSAYPLVDKLQLKILSLSEGYCELSAPRNPSSDGIFDSFHGGLLMTIADTAACIAIFTLTGVEAKLATTDMNIRFLAPCLSQVTAKASVIKLGKTMCPVTIDLFDEANRHVAVAQVNYMLLFEPQSA